MSRAAPSASAPREGSSAALRRPRGVAGTLLLVLGLVLFTGDAAPRLPPFPGTWASADPARPEGAGRAADADPLLTDAHLEADPTALRAPSALPAPPARARVSLNHASLAELEALPGIGPALAARIVADRPYRSTADLDRVRGIGPKLMARLSPRVVP